MTDARPRILFVEDSPSVAFMLKNTLQGYGMEVTTALNGTDALTILRSDSPFDLLLTDIMMPGISGMELIQLTRQMAHRQYMPIVVLSTLRSPEQIHEATRIGATAWVIKPCRGEDLLRILGKACPKIRELAN